MTAVPHRNGERGGGWTLDTLQEHHQALDAANEKFMVERDRRYSEVNIEREKALKIKEEADKAALGLAREIQSYKDEKANQLREQIGSERGTYATKEDLAASMREIAVKLEAVTSYMAGKGGEDRKSTATTANIVSIVAVIYGIMATIGVAFALLRH